MKNIIKWFAHKYEKFNSIRKKEGVGEALYTFFLWFVSINPEKSLHRTPLFWLPVLVFVGGALVLAYPYYCLCIPKPEMYGQLFEALRYPIFIASIAIPLTVSVSRFHSSKQTAKKLTMDDKNETFKLYFEHKKLFKEHAGRELKSNENSSIFDLSEEHFYHFVFPFNSTSNLLVEVDLIRVVNEYKSLVIKAYEAGDEIISMRAALHPETPGSEKTAVTRMFAFMVSHLSSEIGLSNTDRNLRVKTFDEFRALFLYMVPGLIVRLASFEVRRESLYAVTEELIFFLEEEAVTIENKIRCKLQ